MREEGSEGRETDRGAEEKEGRREEEREDRTDCQTTISRLVQMRDRLVPAAGDVEVPSLSWGNEVEDVVTCSGSRVNSDAEKKEEG